MNLFRKKLREPACDHRWEEIGRNSFPPRKNVHASGWAADSDDFKKMAHGFTTVELQCEFCGDVTSRTLIGRIS